MISPTEIDRERPVTHPRLRTSPTSCSAGSIPIDKTIRDRPLHFRVVGVSEKKGAIFGQSQDDFAIIPLGMFQKMFGTRDQPAAARQAAARRRSSKAAMDDATVALRVERRLRPVGARQLRHLHVRHAARHLLHGHQRHLRRADRRRRAVAGRRRHRHHEHHADGGQRADARDRAAQGARRAPARHHVADPHRVGDAVHVRRPRRHEPRIRAGA